MTPSVPPGVAVVVHVDVSQSSLAQVGGLLQLLDGGKMETTTGQVHWAISSLETHTELEWVCYYIIHDNNFFFLKEGVWLSHLFLGGVCVHDGGGCVCVKSSGEVSFLSGSEEGCDGVEWGGEDGSWRKERQIDNCMDNFPQMFHTSMIEKKQNWVRNMRCEVRRCSSTCDLQTADVLVRGPNLTLHIHTAGLETHTHTYI